jgi:type IV pilus assembly protein PilV
MLKVKPYSFSSPKSQSGVLLIEAMVAILIFTIGVIALMGVQAAAVRSNSDAKIRMDAEFFADQLLSEMTVDGRNPITGNIDFALLQAKYGSGPAGGGFSRWRTRVQDVANGGIPQTGIATPLTVIVTQATTAGVPSVPPAAVVAITIQWLGPNDPTATPRRLVTTSVIRL